MTELSILLSFICMIMIGVMFTAWAVCVVGGRDDERAGRDLIE